MGTLGYSFVGELTASALTTPESDDLVRFAADSLARGATHLVLEASSHALSLARLDGARIAVAAFTNLSLDHLDFHGDMASYGEAKAGLFTEFAPDTSVINVDDPMGAELAERAQGRVLRTSREFGDVFPKQVSVDERGIRGQFSVLGESVELETRLVGSHNLDNVLMTLAIGAALGLELEPLAEAYADPRLGVPGRLERCDAEQDDLVVLVDYSHTPDALFRALSTVRALSKGRVHCVFGCGGDRDEQKRPLMGEVAARGADRVVITNDNPRSESPSRIAEAIEKGVRGVTKDYRVVLDRARAIEETLLGAQPGDAVLIAGKGHETYQIVGSERRDFDDRVQARHALTLRRGRGQE